MEIRHMMQRDDRLAISHIYEESWKTAARDTVLLFHRGVEKTVEALK